MPERLLDYSILTISFLITLLALNCPLMAFDRQNDNLYLYSPVISHTVKKVAINEYHELITGVFTAYNLEIGQTDQNPCLASGNHNLCEITEKHPGKCIVATRLYPLHTKIMTKEFGECEVLDRTSIKYGHRLDVLFKNKKDAINFGIKTLEYYIVK